MSIIEPGKANLSFQYGPGPLADPVTIQLASDDGRVEVVTAGGMTQRVRIAAELLSSRIDGVIIPSDRKSQMVKEALAMADELLRQNENDSGLTAG